MDSIQELELVDDRFPAIYTGEKANTLRWQEGDIEPGYLIFYATNNHHWKTLVWVTNVKSTPMDEISYIYDMTPEELHKAMQRHYPDIKIDSDVVFVEHLSPQEIKLALADEIKSTLKSQLKLKEYIKTNIYESKHATNNFTNSPFC